MDADYAIFHRNRKNLVIHIFAVPLFVGGVVAAIWLAVVGSYLIAAAMLPLPVISLALQGRGHKLEPMPPRPFTGPANFAGRIFAEQFVRFPLYVLSGGWARALRDDGTKG